MLCIDVSWMHVLCLELGLQHGFTGSATWPWCMAVGTFIGLWLVVCRIVMLYILAWYYAWHVLQQGGLMVMQLGHGILHHVCSFSLCCLMLHGNLIGFIHNSRSGLQHCLCIVLIYLGHSYGEDHWTCSWPRLHDIKLGIRSINAKWSGSIIKIILWEIINRI